MREGIKVGEIRKALKHNKNLATESKGKEGYPMKEEQWGIYDSPIEDFAINFCRCLPREYQVNFDSFTTTDLRTATIGQGKALKNYIERTLSDKKELTAIEFGGPGSELFRGFTKDFFSKTMGVCLKDIRKNGTRKYDEINNHFIIEGDILDTTTNDKLISVITQTIGANKTDLIISRMEGPLKHINTNLSILDRIIRNWYKILNENGLMFIQFEFYPTQTPDLIEKWSDTIKEKFPEIDIQIDKGTMRIHKKAGAPEELPPATQLFN